MRALLLAAVFAASAVGQLAVTDQAGREVILPPRVERVVDLHGGAKWIIYALGGADLLVGAYFVTPPTHPLAQATLAELDPHHREKELPILPTLEALVALRPDVVFASSVVHGALADLLAEVGITTVLLFPETLDLLEDAFVLIGAVLGREERARALAARFHEMVEEVKSAAEGVEHRPEVYFAAYYPLNIYAGDVIQNVITELAGGVPLGKEFAPYRAGAFWYRANVEQVVLWDPEVIIVPSYSRASREDFFSDPAFSGTRAVKAGRVYRFPSFFGPWDTPSPEVVLGLLWLAEALHPGATGLDLVGEVVRFYREFYGCELPADEVAAFLGQ
ncbi:ABC transporter substrate-binding protein [Candidatus Bipolaricaulota bacterium]|nr:ABC transporter substrate-binding protein [Candidatus Bipolaricaulota bacterium]